MWHKKCRCDYTHKKPCHSVKKKRLLNANQTFSTAFRNSGPSAAQTAAPSVANPKKMRFKTKKFEAKATYVICNKRWRDGKAPVSKITMPYQPLLIEKAMELKRQDVILRLQGAGHDLVANDICYHKKCMNAFKATRPKTSTKG